MKFTTRVELHGASESDYLVLYSAMERAGFSRTITGDNGITYHLPQAEYDSVGSNAEQVRESAARAASATGRGFSILVTMAGDRAWSGLSPAAPVYRPPLAPYNPSAFDYTSLLTSLSKK